MIYYIYKVRRKQTSIHFSRSVPTHRYLRYISWISWNGHRPQPFTSWVSRSVPQFAHALFSRRRLYPKAAIATPLSLLPPGGQANALRSSSRRRKQLSFLFRAPLRVILPALLYPRSLAVPPAVHLRPVHLRPSHKQKMRARSIAPRTRSPRLSNVLKKA